MELPELLKIAGQPHLIASAETANLYLAELQGYISALRLEVNEAELKSDLLLNKLLKEGKGVELQKSNWKVSPEYLEWREKKGLLSDIRAVRRMLERHSSLLEQQQKFTPKTYDRVI